MLVDHADAGVDGIAWRGEMTGLPLTKIVPASGLYMPGQHVHQRALAGAVLAQQRVDLARAQIKIDVVVGEHAGESLDDAAHLDDVSGGEKWRSDA